MKNRKDAIDAGAAHRAPRRAAKSAVLRDALLAKLTAHVLHEGLSGTSLRPLAKAARTSDRMLLYYFAGKDELIAAVLERAADDLRAMLGAGEVGPEPQPFERLLEDLRALTATDAVRPYMRLWMDLIAVAARGGEPHREIAGRIVDGFVDWIVPRLAVPPDRDPRAEATQLLATLDGIAQIEAAGRNVSSRS